MRRLCTLLLCLLACKETKEPEATGRPAAATNQAQSGEPREGDVPVTTDAPIHWDAPAGWTLNESSDSTARRAGYSIPRVGDDKEDGELLVLYFGKGKAGERDAQWDSWFGQFDGDAKKAAKRDSFKVADNDVELFEFTGNYKLNVGPHKKRQTRSPVQMVKKDFRMIGVFMKTPARGNWFFRLVGPDQTVAATKEAFLEMLRSVR